MSSESSPTAEDPVVTTEAAGEEIKAQTPVNQVSGECKEAKPRSELDGPPDDIRGFFGHPLTAATTAINGEDTHASAAALLHEYINLPAIDKSGMRIADKFSSIYDFISRSDSKREGGEGEGLMSPNAEADYMMLIQNDVDKFFNQSSEVGRQVQVKVTEASQNESIVTSSQLAKAKDLNRQCSFEKHDVICSQKSDEAEKSKSVDVVPVTSVMNITPTTPQDGFAAASHQFDHQNLASGNAVPFNRVQTTLAQTSTIGQKSLPAAADLKAFAAGVSCHNGATTDGKTQDISKHLIKALTEKILKKRLNEQLANHVPVTTQPPSTVANTAVQSCFIQQTLDLSTTKLSNFPMKHEGFLNELNEGGASLNVDHPYPVMTSSVSNSVSSSLPHVQTTLPMPTNSAMMGGSSQGHCFQMLQPVQSLPNAPVTAVTQNSYMPSANYFSPPTTSDSGYNVSCPLGHSPPQNNQIPDRDIMLERYIHQQQYFHDQHNFQYGGNHKENYNLKSPDSGFQEPCVSPTDANSMAFKEVPSNYSENSTTEKVVKRRRSAPPVYMKQYWPGAEKLNGLNPIIPKLERDPTGFTYFLETPISTTQRLDEDKITYLNKGQYYPLSLEFNGDHLPKSQTIKTVIMAVFREDKGMDDEMKAWEFWHSRQHSYKQRVMDIDTKNSQGVLTNCIDELAFNGVAIRWNPRESPAKVNLAMHCLSTDFSNQKGVKGLPLHIQIDTFENPKDTCPISRAYLQIKVFCDKGAERKTRDEEKRRAIRMKSVEVESRQTRKRQEEVFHTVSDRSEFYVMADLQTPPVLFNPVQLKSPPDEQEEEFPLKTSPLNLTAHDEDGGSSITSGGDCFDRSEEGFYPPLKRQRRDSYCQYRDYPKILLYVREQHETVFTALMLRIPSLSGFIQAVEEKYKIPAAKVKSTYKRSKKGILVKMDDNIVRHYTHESTFMIEFNSAGEDKEIILTEIECS